MQYNAEFFCPSVLPDTKRNLWDGKHRKMLRVVQLHMDNAPSHNAKRPRYEIARTKITRSVHSTYSPDATPSDFFFVGCLKSEMEGFTVNSHLDILAEISRIFQEISKKTLMAVDDKWITQLEWITEHRREYHHME
jgi:hypothetical protein